MRVQVTKAPERIGTRGTTEYKKAVLPCRLNPLCLLCTCKGFKHHAICSHVLAISHLLKDINIHEELKPLCKKREAHRPKKARGALSMQPDDGADVEDEGEGGSTASWPFPVRRWSGRRSSRRP